MNVSRLVLSSLLLGGLLVTPACGKKGPPTLPVRPVSIKVVDLKGDRVGNDIVLEGNFTGLGGPGKESRATGVRVYFAQFPMENPPCAGCPIEYQDHDNLGPEVIKKEGFLYRLKERSLGQTYFFRVNIIGPDGTLGPSSNQAQVTME